MVFQDRIAAMVLLLATLVVVVLMMLALFSVAPIFTSCLFGLLYCLYYFIANESSSAMHHAQEFENRFWTLFAVLLASASLFVPDSPVPMVCLSANCKLILVVIVGYGVHMWDRMVHRKEMSRQVAGLRRGASAAQSLVRLNAMVGHSAEDKLERISLALSNIDQLLVPSTINNFINQQFILRNEREIISIFEDAQPKMLNWLISHVKLALVFYKIKDHRNYRCQHRTELIELLAVDRVSALTVLSRVLLLRSLQLMKLPANPRAEHWVRNIILSTHQDDLSELKTMTDSKGDYFCMNKLIYDDIRSGTVRQDILNHFRKEAAVQQAHMDMGTRRARQRMQKGWRKILSDVDDTLTSSGGKYPAGIDTSYNKRVVYPGVIGLYRELDLGIHGPEEFGNSTVGNLVFLSARPHVYKDLSEKQNFKKFQKLREREGSKLHTIPSLLAGDLSSGREFVMTGDFEPLARKKFDNFKRFISIYPEYKHFFVCDNGQGDVRAGELMHDQFPKHFIGLFVHIVQDVQKSYGFDAERWRKKGLMEKTCFFRQYPDAALYAATRVPPLIQMRGLNRICHDAVADFDMILPSQWSSETQKNDRRSELNQSLWRCNEILKSAGERTVPLIQTTRQWQDGEKVKTLYGIATIVDFDPIFDLYKVEVDWRPLDEQVREYEASKKEETSSRGTLRKIGSKLTERNPMLLQTVVEEDDESNYLSPATSFDASKRSSKQSLLSTTENMDLAIPASVEEEKTDETDDAHGAKAFTFDVGLFDDEEGDEKGAKGPMMTLEETDTTDQMFLPGNPEICLLDRTLRAKRGKFRATIQGRYISKYTPPVLPKLPKEESTNASRAFSFWDNSIASSLEKKSTEKAKYSKGERVTTPFGVGVVLDYRSKDQIVVVEMKGPWKATAFLQESVLKRDGSGFLGTITSLFSAQASPTKHRPSQPSRPQHAPGAVLHSPYGEGVVIGPGSFDRSTPTDGSVSTDKTKPSTISISLTSWTLRDGSHPNLYCTSQSADSWREKPDDVVGYQSSVFSMVSGFLSGTVESLKKIVPREIEAPLPIQIEVRDKFERYYQDGAAVTTQYGDGTVVSFRGSDGFYLVSLHSKYGTQFATAYLQEDCLSYRLAQSCVEGYPVLTTYGSGVLQSVNPTTGVHCVVIPTFNALCYLQPDQVMRPLKAAKGEDVSTRYGEGKVMRYRMSDDMYEIKLQWGTLHAVAPAFDRIDDRLEDKGGFNMRWILNYFYSRAESANDDGTPRSRSNSISGRSFSMLSQSTLV